MSIVMHRPTQSSERAEKQIPANVVAREPKTMLRRIVIVAESEHDLGWLGNLKAANFEPILLTSNFDAVQMLVENHELRMVLFAQRSMMMDGIAACQLLRQSRSEDDAAVVMMLNENLDQAVIEAFAAGAADVVCHPFHTGELIARLDATRQRLLLSDAGDIASPGFQTEETESLDQLDSPNMTTDFDEPMQERQSRSSERSKPAAPRRHPEVLESRDAVSHEPSSPQEPEPQTRIATRLAGDWLLTHDLPHGIAAPTLDLTQLKFVPSMPAHQMESARQRGELSEVLLDRVWVCPQCRAVPSFRPACPCCGSAGVERDRMLHHFACAFVGPTAEFQLTDEGLSCPKCCAQRLMVGTDCEFLNGPWQCSDCDWSPAELEIVGHCLKCGFRFPAEQAVLEDLIGHCECRGTSGKLEVGSGELQVKSEM